MSVNVEIRHVTYCIPSIPEKVFGVSATNRAGARSQAAGYSGAVPMTRRRLDARRNKMEFIEIEGRKCPVIKTAAEYDRYSEYCMPAWCSGCKPNVQENKCMSCGKMLVPPDELEKLSLYV